MVQESLEVIIRCSRLLAPWEKVGNLQHRPQRARSAALADFSLRRLGRGRSSDPGRLARRSPLALMSQARHSDLQTDVP